MTAGISTAKEAEEDSAPPHVLQGDRRFPAPRDPRLRRFLDYWCALRRGLRIPLRRALDPVDVTWAMPNILLLKYDPEGGDFRVRVAGERIQALFGVAAADRTLWDLLPYEIAQEATARFAKMRATPSLCYESGALLQAADRQAVGESLVCPLSDAGETVDYLIGMAVYEVEPVRGPHRAGTPAREGRAEPAFTLL